MPKRKPDVPAATDDVVGRIRQHLTFLGLPRIDERLDEHLAWATKERPAPSALLERVFADQAAVKLERRVERRIKRSGLPAMKMLETFDWPFQPKLDKAVVMELARLDFVRRAEDLILTGKSGTGKSHILLAFGLRACKQQISVRYARCVDLLDDLYAGLADGTYPTRMKEWVAPELLIIDDVGLGQVRKREDEPTPAHTLYNLIDQRHTKTSTAITSNIKLSAWGRYLGDATVAAALLDRLAMRSLRIDIDGPSYRQHVAMERARLGGGSPPDDTTDA